MRQEEKRRHERHKIAYTGSLLDMLNRRNKINFKMVDVCDSGACMYCDKRLKGLIFEMSTSINQVSGQTLSCLCVPWRVFTHEIPDKETKWKEGAAVFFTKSYEECIGIK